MYLKNVKKNIEEFESIHLQPDFIKAFSFTKANIVYNWKCDRHKQ